MSRVFYFYPVIKFLRNNIETERLLLKPYDQSYQKEFFELISSNKRRLAQSFPRLILANQTEADTKEFIQRKIFDWNNNKAYGLLLFLKENKQLIGHVNFKEIDWKKNQAELAYFIDEKFEGKGMMTEILKALLSVGFEQIQFHRIVARIHTDNIPSKRVLEKAGLKYEGTHFQDHTTYDNQKVDTYAYGIHVEDYRRNVIRD